MRPQLLRWNEEHIMKGYLGPVYIEVEDPQVGEVTPLRWSRKITLLYMQFYNPAIPGCTFSRLLNGR